MTQGRVFVIGAGLSGLSAAVVLAKRGIRVEVIEAAGRAGGRCRSYFDAALGQTIDNGNHLILSGNHATHDFLHAIGAEESLAGPQKAEFDFADVSSGARWRIRPNEGALAWWIFAKTRRVPGTRIGEYADLAKLAIARDGRMIKDVIRCDGPLWDRLMRPLLLAALNTPPEIASAALAGSVLRETLAKGGRAYRPRIAHPTLAAAFVDPAVAFIERAGGMVRLGQRVRKLIFDGDRLISFSLADTDEDVAPSDVVVLATPPWVSGELVPGLAVPDAFHAIVNAHYRIAPPTDAPLMTGVIGGTAEWIFAFPDRISITVSAADAIADLDREVLAETLWRDVARVFDFSSALPPWQIVKEKRATFSATPDQVTRRPKAGTRWSNLVLAGDWTDTGLPATIEGAIRSGSMAAELALARIFV